MWRVVRLFVSSVTPSPRQRFIVGRQVSRCLMVESQEDTVAMRRMKRPRGKLLLGAATSFISWGGPSETPWRSWPPLASHPPTSRFDLLAAKAWPTGWPGSMCIHFAPYLCRGELTATRTTQEETLETPQMPSNKKNSISMFRLKIDTIFHFVLVLWPKYFCLKIGKLLILAAYGLDLSYVSLESPQLLFDRELSKKSKTLHYRAD